MSYIALVEQSSTPPIPPTGKVRIFVNTSGALSSIDDAGVVTAYSAAITQEQIEDYVGALLQDTSSVDVTYNDAGNAITFTVLAGGVDHNALLNYSANQHIDHTTVSISAGTGLTGGGTIETNRTISMPNTGTPGTYGSSTQVPVITTDTQGRVTSISLATVGASTAADVVNVPAGNIAATNVQAAINELDSEKVPNTRSVFTGTGLTGGGDLSSDRTISMPAVGTSGTYGAASSVPVLTTDTQGRVSNVINTAISILASAVTDFATTVQSTVLTGLSTATNSAIIASDTVIASFGKLQAQITARPTNWIQYTNSANQTTTQDNTALTAITLDVDTDSRIGSLFTKFSGTELQTNYAGYVRISYKAGIQNTSSNDRAVRVGVLKNGTPIAHSYSKGIGKTNAFRHDGASAAFIAACVNGDKFQLGFSNAENVADTCSVFANDVIFTLDARGTS